MYLQDRKINNASTCLGLGIRAGAMNRNIIKVIDRKRQAKADTGHFAKLTLGLGVRANNMSIGADRKAKRGISPITTREATLLLAKKLIKQKCLCAVTGLPLVVRGAPMSDGFDWLMYSPDRLDNTIGYCDENVRLVITSVNLAVTHCSSEENDIVCQMMRNGASSMTIDTSKARYNFAEFFTSPRLWLNPQVIQWQDYGFNRKPKIFNEIREEILTFF